MTAATITIFSLLTLLFFLVGGLIAWTAKDYFYSRQYVPLHPEMFDENGNIIPDEILALRFENYYDDDSDEEED